MDTFAGLDFIVNYWIWMITAFGITISVYWLIMVPWNFAKVSLYISEKKQKMMTLLVVNQYQQLYSVSACELLTGKND